MNVGILLLYLVFPAIFLGVATLTPGKMTWLKGVCIALAYFSLVFLDNVLGSPDPDAILRPDGSSFGMVFMIITIWSVALLGFGDTRSKEDNSR